MKDSKITVNEKECDRNIRTYGDVIRHMTNQELALFLDQMQADVELGLLAIMRAKSYPHRYAGDAKVDSRDFGSMYHFMEKLIKEVKPNEYEIFGVDNWQDMCQWEWQIKKNFGMDVIY